jgi:hypothetical protein
LDSVQLKALLDKLFDLSRIEWPTHQLPHLVNAVMQVTGQKAAMRAITFEALLDFFYKLRRKIVSAQTDKL